MTARASLFDHRLGLALEPIEIAGADDPSRLELRRVARDRIARRPVLVSSRFA